VDEYFNSTTRMPVKATTPFLVETEELPKSAKLLRFPVKRAA
jgi:hypothetical protein